MFIFTHPLKIPIPLATILDNNPTPRTPPSTSYLTAPFPNIPAIPSKPRYITAFSSKPLEITHRLTFPITMCYTIVTGKGEILWLVKRIRQGDELSYSVHSGNCERMHSAIANDECWKRIAKMQYPHSMGLLFLQPPHAMGRCQFSYELI